MHWRTSSVPFLSSAPLCGNCTHVQRKSSRDRRCIGSRDTLNADTRGRFLGRLAEFKTEFLNHFVQHNRIGTIIELGCGDGEQLVLSKYPSYVGVDVEPQSIALCREKFRTDPTKTFYIDRDIEQYYLTSVYDAALSLDVIYHLLEDSVYDGYMTDLFRLAKRYVNLFEQL
jgi:hypothetical protein